MYVLIICISFLISRIRYLPITILFLIVTGIRVSVPSNILPAGCPINDGLMRGRGGGAMPQRGLMRRPIPSRGGQLEIAGVVVGQWGPNYGQPGRLPQPLQGHPRGRIPPQVGYHFESVFDRSFSAIRHRCEGVYNDDDDDDAPILVETYFE